MLCTHSGQRTHGAYGPTSIHSPRLSKCFSKPSATRTRCSEFLARARTIRSTTHPFIIKIASIYGYLPSARHCTKCFTYGKLFNPHKSAIREILLFSAVISLFLKFFLLDSFFLSCVSLSYPCLFFSLCFFLFFSSFLNTCLEIPRAPGSVHRL